uniref:Uncharacterized protein n=1 Tax=Lactuca sativa TaxID=4236 RepID=A0A9R1XNA3_LACSA|nr:hypothetical protein LSAT_V11C200072620 [Lactuca sativa]
MINKLLIEPDTLFEPMIRQPKGISSTARDPSRFELVESSQTPKTSSSTGLFQINNEVSNTISYINNENNLFDLNAYPTFSSDDMTFE